MVGFLDSLIGTESGGNWQAQNNAMGAGGKAGHFGRLQFGHARLADAMNAGVIPQGVTPQQFMADPAMQQRVEAWHFSDIDRNAERMGLNRFVGQNVGGITITPEAIRAMAHLGGIGGAAKFLETGGRHNPADVYGTSLADYARKHGGTGGDMRGGGGMGSVMGGAGSDELAEPKGLLGFLGNEDKRARMAIALEGMTLDPNQGYMQMLGEGIKDRRTTKEAAKSRNATAAWLRSQGRDDLAAAIESGVLSGTDAARMAFEAQAAANAPQEPVRGVNVGDNLVNPITGEVIYSAPQDATGGTEYGLSPQYGVDKDGNPVIIQLSKSGTAIQTPLPEGVTFQKEPIKIDAGTEWVLLDPISRQPVGRVPKGVAEAAAATAEGKAQGEDVALLASIESKMPGLEKVVDDLGALSEKATYTEVGKGIDYIRRQAGMAPSEGALARAEYVAMVDNQVLPMLRDTFGAAFTVKEGETLRATLGGDDKSPAEKQAILKAFIAQKRRDLEALTSRVATPAPRQPAAPSGLSPDAAKWLED